MLEYDLFSIAILISISYDVLMIYYICIVVIYDSMCVMNIVITLF